MSGKCPKCEGSGYISAAKEAAMESAPLILQPIGVSYCYMCNGSGEWQCFLDNLTDEDWEQIAQSLTSDEG